MAAIRPSYLALLVCVAGLVFMPFAQLATDLVNWQLFGDGYDPIFSDGFETGDTGAWSNTVPLLGTLVFLEQPTDRYSLAFDMGIENLELRRGESLAILVGFSMDGKALFAVDLSHDLRGLRLRSRAQTDGGTWVESEWARLTSAKRLEVSWRRALPDLQDGELLVSVDRALLAWVVDLDNDEAPVESMLLARDPRGRLLVRSADD